MAGYVVKIVLEDTHPPVWRRLIIPERISFSDLHEMIQIAFGWENCHLADFSGPSNKWRFEADDCCAMDWYLHREKWMRYTYDFGDDWRHKITLEKLDESYDKRHATLVKYKGNNFVEDSGGIWGIYESEEEYSVPFDPEETQRRLEAFLSDESEIQDQSADELFLQDFVNHMLGNTRKKEHNAGRINRNLERLEAYFDHIIEQHKGNEINEQTTFDFAKRTLELPDYTPKTVAQLLEGLTAQQAKDYCKYLKLDVSEKDTIAHKTERISAFWHEHPEYLLYVLEEEQIAALKKYTAKEENRATTMLDTFTIQKAVMLGLLDVEFIEETIRLNPAKDAKDLLKTLTVKKRKPVYRMLEKFSEVLGALINTYGMMDFDSLYKAYCRMSKSIMERTEFERCVYWHAQFNRYIATCETSHTHTRYALHLGVHPDEILRKTEEYASDMDYAVYSREQILAKGESVNQRGFGPEFVFNHLHYSLKIEEEEASFLTLKCFEMVVNGMDLNAILGVLCGTLEFAEVDSRAHSWVESCAELWEGVVMMMLETELPMLKGRSRNTYSEETGRSPWTIDMVKDEYNEQERRKPDAPMYAFSEDVQEKMYHACMYADYDAIRNLLKYKKQKRILSEEFTYLLAKSCCRGCMFKEAEMLIKELKKSSKDARKAAKRLEDMQRNGADVMDDVDDFNDFDDVRYYGAFDEFSEPEDFGDLSPLFDWRAQRYADEEEFPETFVREEKKIGRNEPCPCGSGKKYKNCCGKNS